MELTPEKRKQLTKWLIGIAAACILIFLGVQNIRILIDTISLVINLIMPLILGLVFALILNVPMHFFESHLFYNTSKRRLQKLRKPLSFIISLVFISGILIGIIWLVIPELADAIKIIAQGAANYVNQISSLSKSNLSTSPFENFLLSIDWDSIQDNLQNWLKNQSSSIVNTAVGTIGSIVDGIFDFFISFVFAIYILFSKDTLKTQTKRLIRVWIPNGFGEWLIHAASVASQNFRNFISGQSLEAIILGLLCMIGMWIFGFPYAPMIGALVGVTALIPVVGGFIGAGVGAFMILTVDPMKALFFLIYILILQQLEGNIIYPKVMGSRVNLPSMWILAAVTIGGGIAGPIGMLLAVPIGSTIYVLIKEATDKREISLNSSKKLPKSDVY